MKTLLQPAVLAFAISLGLCPVKSDAVVIDGVDWTFNWDGNILPNQTTPPFDLYYTQNFVTDGMTTTAIGSGAGMSGGAWQGGADEGQGPSSTLEFRMRILSQGPPPAEDGDFGSAFFAGWNGHRYNLFFNALDTPYVDFGGSNPSGTNIFEVDTADWHTYRLVFTAGGGDPALYVDDVLRLTQGGSYAPANVISFARYTGWVEGSSSSEWDYIRWTNAGAYAPIPEPSTFALLGACGVAALAFRRRASRRS